VAHKPRKRGSQGKIKKDKMIGNLFEIILLFNGNWFCLEFPIIFRQEVFFKKHFPFFGWLPSPTNILGIVIKG
jgi:hypothetical protein